MIRHGRVTGIEPLGRCVEKVEAIVGNPGDNLGSDASPGKGFSNGKKASSARYGGNDGVGIERFNTAEVHDLPAEYVACLVVGCIPLA